MGWKPNVAKKIMHLKTFNYAALTYTEYPLRMLKFENRAEITEYDANGRGGACRKRRICEKAKECLQILTNVLRML